MGIVAQLVEHVSSGTFFLGDVIDAAVPATSHAKRVVIGSSPIYSPNMDEYAQLAKAADCKSVTLETT